MKKLIIEGGEEMMLGIGITIIGIAGFFFSLTNQRTHFGLILAAYVLSIASIIYGISTTFTAYEEKQYSASSTQEIESAVKACPNIKNLIANRRPTESPIKNYELKKWIKSCNEPTLDEQKKAVGVK